jgi:hypothetical protein
MPRESTKLEVVPDGAKWIVREHGIGRLTTHPDKSHATAAARAVAAIHTPCELVIRNADGSIESQENFKQPGK